MKRFISLAVLLLSATTLVTGCMSPEQLAETAKNIKNRKEELEKKNPEIVVVFAKHTLSRGAVINADDVEERTVHQLSDHVPDDACRQKLAVIMKKTTEEIAGGSAVCNHAVTSLIDGH